MTTYKAFILAIVTTLAFFTHLPVQAAEMLRVVASFSILADMAKRVGGDKATVRALVGYDGDSHVYQPSPDDAKAVARADVMVINGLKFEGWLERLIKSAEYEGPVVVATDGARLLEVEDDHGEDHSKTGQHSHDHGLSDPHAWHDLRNAEVYVRNIARGFSHADPGNTRFYGANADAYVMEIRSLEAEFRPRISALPADRRRVITTHGAFGYFARAYGITFRAPVGMSTESEASARDMAKLVRQIQKESIAAVFVENITDGRLLRQIATETGAVIGGTLYSDALSGLDGPASTYLDMMRHNLRTIIGALGS